MNPAIILAILDGALSIIEKVAPTFVRLFKSGEISLEDQKAIKDRIDALSNPDLFSGPEWQVDKE